MCKVLCIDAGWAAMGYCFFGHQCIRFGELHYKEGDKAKRATAIAQDLAFLIAQYKPENVICEDFIAYGSKGTKAQNVSVTIGVIAGLCCERGITFSLVNHNHWKAKWKKLTPIKMPDEIGEHAMDAFMMGVAMEAGNVR